MEMLWALGRQLLVGLLAAHAMFFVVGCDEECGDAFGACQPGKK